MGAIHPVTGFRVDDDRLQTSPSGGQPLELGGLFMPTFGLSLPRNPLLGNVGQKIRFSLLLTRVSSIRPKRLLERSCGFRPVRKSVSQGRRVMPVIWIFLMDNYKSVGIDRQGDLAPVFRLLARLVLSDAGEMRLMIAINRLALNRLFLDSNCSLHNHLRQNLVPLSDLPDKGCQCFFQPLFLFSSGLHHYLPGIFTRLRNQVDGSSGKGEERIHSSTDPLLLVPLELRHAQDRRPAHPDKAWKPFGNSNALHLNSLYQAELPNQAPLKKPRIGWIGESLPHRRDINPHKRRDPLSFPDLLPDKRLNRLRSYYPQTFLELVQRGTLHKMGLFRRNHGECHPGHVLMNPGHHFLVRQVIPMLQDHEPNLQPGGLRGRSHLRVMRNREPGLGESWTSRFSWPLSSVNALGRGAVQSSNGKLSVEGCDLVSPKRDSWKKN